MALREFEITDAQARLHTWRVASNQRRECVDCRAIAEVINDTCHLMYPGDSGKRCEDRLEARHMTHDPSIPDVASNVVQVDYWGIHVRFGPGTDPQYVAAVLDALRRAS